VEAPSKLFAAVLGLTAFAIAVASGLLSGHPGQEVLTRAIVSMVVCYPVGSVLGAVAGRAIAEFTGRYQADHPVTDLNTVAAEYASVPEY